jgi:mRNA interferase RelE/StbE
MSERRYTLEFLSRAEKALHRLPKDAASRVSRAIEALAVEPRPPGCKKLEAADNQYRIRVGAYRVIYRIYEDKLIVLVIELGDRKDIYRRR